ncbi:MAG: PEP-CTERM sorting domain-containing protein [Phycisphaerae bacterium]|nr:PEP-CTERM sorting domain-containing protein [Phycisphaerae bacterium]
MKKIIAIMVGFVLITGITANAALDLTAWQAQAAATAGNVVADNTGWTFDGSAGVDFDYGNLDEDGNLGSNGAGTSVEYIFNLTDNDYSVALGSFFGWNNAEINVVKLEQWANTGVFGLTSPGVVDSNFNGALSTFDVDTHVVFINRADGDYEIYVNGVSMGLDTRGGGKWVTNGGLGKLGAFGKSDGTQVDICSGDIYAVGTYNRALDAGEVADLAAAVPEPATMILFGLGSLAAIRRRKA